MAVTVNWDSELERVVLYRFDGQWSWGDFLRAFARELELAASLGGARYDVLAEMTRDTRLPAGPAIAYVYGIYRRYPSNWGVTAVAAYNPFIRTMFDVGFTIYPDTQSRFFVADNLEAARQVIQRSRSAPAANGASYQSR
ncbi:MAG: hypothetical protein ACUVSX_13440 [Aggregatilineales bacterium]